MTDPVTNPPEGLADAVRGMSTTMTHLAATVTDQNERLDTQNAALAGLETSQKHQRFLTRLLAGLYAVDVALVIASIITFALIITSVQTTNERIEATIVRLDQTIATLDTTRSRVLCPLYRLLVAAESPEGRARYQPGPDAYDQAFRDIRGAYDELRCGQ